MRFFVPEWDDRVDANYDFLHDEHSTLRTDDRDLAYIWDLFDSTSVPIDGVLLSREQAEASSTKSENFRENGIYGAQPLDIPDWMPTISDCGAWGYKSLPFPPYDNAEMLDFYEDIGVTTGVTIDHLVLGAGHTARLYLNEEAFSSEFSQSDIPDELSEAVDVMIDAWPTNQGGSTRQWPSYVEEEEPSIYGVSQIEPFTQEEFTGDTQEILSRLEDDPRAVYRDDDMQYRYDLTLRNARAMRALYEQGEYSFRLMCAVQGWDVESYVSATEEVLDLGYDYLGIGGVAGSPENAVEKIVTGVGNAIKDHERATTTRVDTHVFGFAKTGAFETIGRTGMTSFDSASMLRSAWTGGDNYHLDSDERYDAIRVRYSNHRDDPETAVEKAVRGQELLYALRAFGDRQSISEALRTWHDRATEAFEAIEPYLREHRHDARYDQDLITDTEAAFRDHFEHARPFRANFGDPLNSSLVKLLREDDPDDPVPFDRYEKTLTPLRSVFSDWTPTLINRIEALETQHADQGTYEQLWPLVESYATWGPIDDHTLLDDYRSLLRNRPWERCLCPICSEHGIEVAIFRGNNRNRRRGFHNTRRFYDEFERKLPKILVLTRATTSIHRSESVQAHLKSDHSAFWNAVHDLPVAEVGVVTAEGVHEWWDDAPSTLSFEPDRLADQVVRAGQRYQDVFVVGLNWASTGKIELRLESADCTLHQVDDPTALRECVLDRLGYEQAFVPNLVMQSGLGEY